MQFLFKPSLSIGTCIHGSGKSLILRGLYYIWDTVGIKTIILGRAVNGGKFR